MANDIISLSELALTTGVTAAEAISKDELRGSISDIADNIGTILTTAIAFDESLKGVARTVGNVERRVEPLMERVGALSDQVREIAAQGREVVEQVNVMSGHLATASLHFSESMALVRDEVHDLRQIVGLSAEMAHEKVEMVSRSFARRTADTATTLFIHRRSSARARDRAIMAGVRRYRTSRGPTPNDRPRPTATGDVIG